MSKLAVNQQEGASIMTLNDDCLFTIMDKLNIWDLMRLQQVNKRLRYLCLLQFSRCKVLNFLSWLPEQMNARTTRQVKQFLGKCCSLRSFEVTISDGDSVQDILKVLANCVSLDALKIEYYYSHHQFSHHPILEGIVIRRRLFLQNVRELHLTRVECCLKDLLAAFPNLEELYCSTIRIRSVGRFPTNKLKSLEIYAQENDQALVLDYVPMLCELEKFHYACLVGGNERYFGIWANSLVTTDFSNNKKLKEIHMKHWAIYDGLLYQLGKSIYGQLETLTYHCCVLITEGIFQSFLATQPNLKTVDIRHESYNLESILFRCVEHYAKTREERTEPLTVVNTWVTAASKSVNFVQSANQLNCAPCERVLLIENGTHMDYELENAIEVYMG